LIASLSGMVGGFFNFLFNIVRNKT
jgi:hypothetical protein